MRLVWALVALAACKETKTSDSPPPRDPPAQTPVAPIPEPPVEAPPERPSKEWSTTETCALQDVELIYVIDDRNRLLSFDPRKLPNDPLHLIGTVNCGGSTPNSMAVDRKGVAWVGFQNGKIHRVSIINAHCDTKGWKAAGATRVFGMGYVTDGPKTETEKLFVAGGVDDPERTLAVIDTEEKTWTPVGSITSPRSNPELTGTSEGKLFAYFPSPGRGLVQELDRTSATVIGSTWKLPGNPESVDAYAFAFYGGVFYVFTTVDGESAVHAIHRKTGKVELAKNHLPYIIVGAGVSTCAPLLERVPE